jgi:hypothetical protein
MAHGCWCTGCLMGMSNQCQSDAAAGAISFRFPAGVVNVRHTRPCGHGTYVLAGTPVTRAGRFGPGCYVWFPESTVMEHGASADGDVTVLFITNKPFAIHYVSGRRARRRQGPGVAAFGFPRSRKGGDPCSAHACSVPCC